MHCFVLIVKTSSMSRTCVVFSVKSTLFRYRYKSSQTTVNAHFLLRFIHTIQVHGLVRIDIVIWLTCNDRINSKSKQHSHQFNSHNGKLKTLSTSIHPSLTQPIPPYTNPTQHRLCPSPPAKAPLSSCFCLFCEPVVQ